MRRKMKFRPSFERLQLRTSVFKTDVQISIFRYMYFIPSDVRLGTSIMAYTSYCHPEFHHSVRSTVLQCQIETQFQIAHQAAQLGWDSAKILRRYMFFIFEMRFCYA